MDFGSIEANLLHIVGEYMALRFRIPSEKGEDIEAEELHAFFALDKSGSMSGSPIRDAKGALGSLIQKFNKVGVPITVLLFSNRMQEMSSEDIGYAPMLEQVESLKAGGGTLFAPVIEAIHTKITTRNMKNVFCVWLSDGQDNKGLGNLIPCMDKFKTDMETYGISIGVHTIGFSGDHDANLLNRLSGSGTRPGSFQFVPPNGRIPVAVNNIYTLAFESSTWARFVSCEGKAYRIEVEKDERKDELNALVYVKEDDLEDCKVEVHRGKAVQYYELEPSRGEVNDFKELVILVTNFVSNTILQVLEMGGEKASQKLQEIRPLIEEMERRIQYLVQESHKLRPFFRKQCQPYFSTTKELITNYYSTLRENSGNQLSNIQIASLNNLAHKNALTRNLERKIAKEVGKNIDMLNESEREIERIVQSINKEELENKYGAQIEAFGECMLSTRNWLEAIMDGDCFCVTLHLERPQNLLGDSLEIRIKNVNTTLLTCDSFIDSALFETKAGQVIQAQRNYQHGQAPAPASSLVNGLPNEVINGVMPIYINEDHWKLARQRLKPMIAWNITVDVLGYLPSQLMTFPFQVFVSTLQASTEFKQFQLNVLKETCFANYRDNRGLILPLVTSVLSDYPSKRLPEHVPNNSVFLAQLYCAYKSGDVQEPQAIFPMLFEEEFRRRLFRKKDLNLHDFCKNLFDVKLERITKLVTEKVLSNSSTAFREQVTPGSEPEDIEIGSFSEELPGKTLESIQKIHKNMQEGGMLRPLLALMNLFEAKEYSSLEDFGIKTNEQKLALVIQSMRDKVNKDRKEAIESKSLVDVFNHEECTQFIKETITTTIKREALAIRARILSERQGELFNERAFRFTYTSDLEEAAGCLMGVKQGDSNFCLFYKGLMSPDAANVIEKAKMLNRGEYKGIKLVCDKIKWGERVVWTPKQKTIHKIWSAHMDKAPKEAWIEAFPDKTSYFEHKYLRLEGNFVPYSKPRINVKDSRHWEGKSQRLPSRKRGSRRGRGARK